MNVEIYCPDPDCTTSAVEDQLLLDILGYVQMEEVGKKWNNLSFFEKTKVKSQNKIFKNVSYPFFEEKGSIVGLDFTFPSFWKKISFLHTHVLFCFNRC